MNHIASALSQILTEELTSFGQFCLFLRAEREALACNDSAALTRITGQKQEVCDKLVNLEKARQAHLGIGANNPAEALKVIDSNLHQQWLRLIELAREAQNLNQVNGVIIETRLKHNQQALALLKSGAEITATYTAGGQSTNVGSSRLLGSA